VINQGADCGAVVKDGGGGGPDPWKGAHGADAEPFRRPRHASERRVGLLDAPARALLAWRVRRAERQPRPPPRFLQLLAARANHAAAAAKLEQAMAALAEVSSAAETPSPSPSPSSPTARSARAADDRTPASIPAAPSPPIPPVAGPAAVTAPFESSLLQPPHALPWCATHRQILLDWHVEVADEFRLGAATLHLAASLVDRALWELPPIARGQLQLLGCACLLLAAKLTEADPIDVDSVVFICDNTCAAQYPPPPPTTTHPPPPPLPPPPLTTTTHTHTHPSHVALFLCP
jgi:cyclin A